MRFTVVPTLLACGCGEAMALIEPEPDGVLRDRQEIVTMIGTRMQTRVPALIETCTEDVEELEVRLQLEFTVERTGAMSGLQVTPVGGAPEGTDALVACVVGQLTTWHFQPIAEPQPVRRTIYVHPEPAEAE